MQNLHVDTVFVISALIQGHHTDVLAQTRHLVRPWCPSCSCLSTSDLSAAGMTPVHQSQRGELWQNDSTYACTSWSVCSSPPSVSGLLERASAMTRCFPGTCSATTLNLSRRIRHCMKSGIFVNKRHCRLLWKFRFTKILKIGLLKLQFKHSLRRKGRPIVGVLIVIF